MAILTYKTSGVCSRAIHIEMDGTTVKQIEFVGGCDGNTTGIASLVQGMDAKEVVKRLKGIRCGFKNTSCPDQLAKALEQYIESESN